VPYGINPEETGHCEFNQYEMDSSADQSSPADRRKAQRFRVTWPVVVRGANFESNGALQDLSSSGALLNLPTALSLGTEVEVLIKVPLRRDNWIGYRAFVLRIAETEAGAILAMKFRSTKPIFQAGCNGSADDSIVSPS
jgi:hypothetical protein